MSALSLWGSRARGVCTAGRSALFFLSFLPVVHSTFFLLVSSFSGVALVLLMWLSCAGLMTAQTSFRNYVLFLYTLLQHQSNAAAELQSTRHSAHHITAKQLLSRLDFNRFYQQNQQVRVGGMGPADVLETAWAGTRCTSAALLISCWLAV